LPTLRLIRVAVGGHVLGDLRPGQWLALKEPDIAQPECFS
jgi:16S rRNA U516 pseudouridylate synthase RsuA-like enzyme